MAAAIYFFDKFIRSCCCCCLIYRGFSNGVHVWQSHDCDVNSFAPRISHMRCHTVEDKRQAERLALMTWINAVLFKEQRQRQHHLGHDLLRMMNVQKERKKRANARNIILYGISSLFSSVWVCVVSGNSSVTQTKQIMHFLLVSSSRSLHTLQMVFSPSSTFESSLIFYSHSYRNAKH